MKSYQWANIFKCSGSGLPTYHGKKENDRNQALVCCQCFNSPLFLISVFYGISRFDEEEEFPPTFLRAVRNAILPSPTSGCIDRKVHREMKNTLLFLSVFYGISRFDEEEEFPPTFLRAVRNAILPSPTNGCIDRKVYREMKNTLLFLLTMCILDVVSRRKTAQMRNQWMEQRKRTQAFLTFGITPTDGRNQSEEKPQDEHQQQGQQEQ
ncbi:hypothetical protein M514_08964 [Trichuris suis]|uniref:Uncharacterized protein n=1 Tax=Trichuris suis TaxID=68888 RepID=A0A085N6Z2_9BILA|nr:hypothetical protein M514_08964 [Trichuris suis]